MTTQEFVNEQSVILLNEDFTDPTTAENYIAIGLTKGLEIAKDFAKYCQAYYIQVSDGVWQSCIDETDNKHYTSSELLSIYLTEKYGK